MKTSSTAEMRVWYHDSLLLMASRERQQPEIPRKPMDGSNLMDQPISDEPSQTHQASDWRQRALLGSAILAVMIAGGLWIYRALNQEPDEPEFSQLASQKLRPDKPKKDPPKIEDLPKPKDFVHAKPKGKVTDNFLDSFGKDPEPDDTGPVLSNKELQQRFEELEKEGEGYVLLEERFLTAKDKKNIQKWEAELKALGGKLEKVEIALEKDLARARKGRPKDPVPQWLTGELLVFIRAEPELIFPFFERARQGKLDNPRLWAGLARLHFQSNEFEKALPLATKALDKSDKDRRLWDVFRQCAVANEKFGLLSKRLDQAFGAKKPDWAEGIFNDAVYLEKKWQAELKLRAAEAKANDLPRVKLVIEHRRFVIKDGQATTDIEKTGKGEIILELFENDAPLAVANFLTLVGSKFYDGTKFFLADPARLVAGGCPLTKNADPADDGTGDPGYFIPDEYDSHKARGHFRGTLAMVNDGKSKTAGCQFLITLTPQPTMDGRFTVFGRVIQGQDVVERITQGRTHPEVAPFGRIIPGDVLIHAEVIRKRNHEYKVIKVK
jgi:cyclophilin family peptidyl-prolyl cis-trans isomerase